MGGFQKTPGLCDTNKDIKSYVSAARGLLDSEYCLLKVLLKSRFIRFCFCPFKLQCVTTVVQTDFRIPCLKNTMSTEAFKRQNVSGHAW